MENLGAMADSRYTGFREIMDRDVLELHCSYIPHLSYVPMIRTSFPLVIRKQNVSVNE